MSGFTLENLQKLSEELEALNYSDLSFPKLDKMIEDGARIEDLALLLNPKDFNDGSNSSIKVRSIPTKHGRLEVIATPYSPPGSMYILRKNLLNKPYKPVFSPL